MSFRFLNALVLILLSALLINYAANYFYTLANYDGFHDRFFAGKIEYLHSFLFLDGNYKEVGQYQFEFIRKWTILLVIQSLVTFLIFMFLPVAYSKVKNSSVNEQTNET